MRRTGAARVVVLGALTAAACSLACDSPSPRPSPGLTLVAVHPDSGSEFDSPLVTISGRGFSAHDIVSVDGVPTSAGIRNAEAIQVTLPPHAPGGVDITVTSESGASATLPHGFTYLHTDPPVVTSFVPSAGFPDGGNMVKIIGSGFQPGTVVTFDGVAASVAPFGPARSSTFLPVMAPRHAPGPVDVVVLNWFGRTLRIPGGYTYAPSETFDFNGTWKGFAWETDAVVGFTIENGLLVSVTCGSVTHTFSSAPTVSQGTFAVKGPDGSMSGQIWSPVEASGLLDIPGCNSAYGWSAFR